MRSFASRGALNTMTTAAHFCYALYTLSTCRPSTCRILHVDCRLLHVDRFLATKTVTFYMQKEIERVQFWRHVDRLHSICRRVVDSVDGLRRQVDQVERIHLHGSLDMSLKPAICRSRHADSVCEASR